MFMFGINCISNINPLNKINLKITSDNVLFAVENNRLINQKYKKLNKRTYYQT